MAITVGEEMGADIDQSKKLLIEYDSKFWISRWMMGLHELSEYYINYLTIKISAEFSSNYPLVIKSGWLENPRTEWRFVAGK